MTDSRRVPQGSDGAPGGVNPASAGRVRHVPGFPVGVISLVESWRAVDLSSPSALTIDDELDKRRPLIRGATPVPHQEPAVACRTLGGKDSVNRLPLPGSLVTDRSPPIRAAIRFATARPRP
jgi:hypothetical protein